MSVPFRDRQCTEKDIHWVYRKEVFVLQIDRSNKYEVRRVLPIRCRLGEGCVWDERNKRLYFVDIEGCRIFGFHPCGGKKEKPDEIWEFDTKEMVGCLVLCENGIVAAVGHRLIRISDDGSRSEVLMELPLPDYVRFNDGKCDSAGRLWVGTMAKSQLHPEAKGCGSLYCIAGNQVLAAYPGYTIPNGMAWDGDLFYHIDTSKGTVEEYRAGENGALNGRRTAVTADPLDGAPDGMCIDAEGNLWVAMWGGGKVNCYDPRTGNKLTEIPVPAKNVSCAAFGDEDMRTLYITTAMDEEGSGGELYAVRLPAAGTVPYRYGGER